ncbi:hypothetical protein HY375_02650 [Candidatus Berkelbacteria bacterium]|nr:hypothetical protein [Candidatus Berkelbacteria bacterium]
MSQGAVTARAARHGLSADEFIGGVERDDPFLMDRLGEPPTSQTLEAVRLRPERAFYDYLELTPAERQRIVAELAAVA